MLRKGGGGCGSGVRTGRWHDRQIAEMGRHPRCPRLNACESLAASAACSLSHRRRTSSLSAWAAVTRAWLSARASATMGGERGMGERGASRDGGEMKKQGWEGEEGM